MAKHTATPTGTIAPARGSVKAVGGDRATPLKVAEAASAQFGWPLHVIDDAADDPTLDQPDVFLKTLREVLVGQ
jgi:hypothetical protein